ncbi:MAG: hypothetical protein JXQ72_05880 [Anaerolineae bacterium]|nr:hypothetical protein [Anaerolineae bacterium]
MSANTDSSNTIPTNPFRSLWYALSQPAPSIIEQEEQRRSRLLAALLLTILAVGPLILVALGIHRPDTIDDPDTIGFWIGLGNALVLYLLNRRGHTNFSAAALIVLMLISFVGLPFLPESIHELFYFAIIPILLTALFFSIRHVIGVAMLALMVPLLISRVTDRIATAHIVEAGQFFLLSTAIVITYINHTRAVERIRRAELQAAYDRVRASEVILEQRVRERTRELQLAKETAEAAQKQAEDANRVKSQFLASMSHELRTPLNAILTFTELISMGTFGPVNEEQVDYLQKSLQSGKHLLSLINDVLDITKIHAGMMKLFIEDDFNVAAELDTIRASVEKMLQDKPVQLVMDVDQDFPLMTCDKRRVRQVLLNLLANAIKFTETGTITISAKRRADDVLFAVSDTGPGIPPDQHDIIFEPFIQTEAGIKHAVGTGLGLPISKRLAEAHGGRLWLDSEPGAGAVFYVALPLQANLTLGEQEMD